jgi:hypothetical protein
MGLNREPKELKDIFNSMPSKINFSEKSIVVDLRNNMEKIMSKSFCNSVIIYDLNNGILRLKVSNPILKTEIQLRKQQIVDKFNEHIVSNAIKGIVLH